MPAHLYAGSVLFVLRLMMKYCLSMSQRKIVSKQSNNLCIHNVFNQHIWRLNGFLWYMKIVYNNWHYEKFWYTHIYIYITTIIFQWYIITASYCLLATQIARFVGPPWGPPHAGPMNLAIRVGIGGDLWIAWLIGHISSYKCGTGLLR